MVGGNIRGTRTLVWETMLEWRERERDREIEFYFPGVKAVG